jgi:hypothetical protein
MNRFGCLALAVIAAAGLAATAPKAQAQVIINVGPAPICPYGYFDYYPYTCAPYGYYGPEWFVNGVFIGAGPWFHGPANFRGHVDNRYDVQRGYSGPVPRAGERPAPRGPGGGSFHGNETRNGRGYVGH